jgi:hypothetical protein
VYSLAFSLLPGKGFWINDNGCKFVQLQGIIKSHYRDFSIPWPGRDRDPLFAYNPIPSPFGHVVQGRLYGTFSPVFPLLSSFPYRLLGFAGLYLIPLAGGLLTLPAVWRLTDILADDPAARRIAQPLAVFLVGLGTPLWFYSMTFWEHAPAVCLTTWSVVCCARFMLHGRLPMLALSAALCACAVYLRDELYLLAMIFTPLCATYSPRKRRTVIVFVVVFVSSVAPLWVFNWLKLGHPLGYHFASGSMFEVGWIRHLSDRASVAADLLSNVHGNAVISAAIAGPCIALWVAYPRISHKAFGQAVTLLAGFALLSGAIIYSGFLTADSPVWWMRGANGLFAACPILILAFIRRRNDTDANSKSVAPRREQLQSALRLITLLYAVLYVLLTPKQHASGIHWGCRYLLPLYPLLGTLASLTLAEWWATHRQRVRIGPYTVCLLLALTVGAQVYSLTLLHSRKQFSARLNDLVAGRPEKVVIASGWFLPQELAHCFFDKEIFLVQNQRHGDKLISTLRQTGVREALYVGWPPAPDAAAAGSNVLDDGRLNFISVEIRPLRLDQ